MENNNLLLLEAIADIAYIAGENNYRSGDSRADISNIILWAKEFEAKYINTVWGEDLDYIETITDFTLHKIHRTN